MTSDFRSARVDEWLQTTCSRQLMGYTPVGTPHINRSSSQSAPSSPLKYLHEIADTAEILSSSNNIVVALERCIEPRVVCYGRIIDSFSFLKYSHLILRPDLYYHSLKA